MLAKSGLPGQGCFLLRVSDEQTDFGRPADVIAKCTDGGNG